MTQPLCESCGEIINPTYNNMSNTWKANVYETQMLLYFILGVMLLHWNMSQFFGWLCIGWGAVTFVSVIVYAVLGVKESRSNPDMRLCQECWDNKE